MKLKKQHKIRRIIREEVAFRVDKEMSNTHNENAKKATQALLEQGELLENFNKKHPEKVENVRKNIETLIQIYSFILNL